MSFQNRNFQFIGRYNSGPFNFNVSKKGFSSSVQNRRGSYNILKPNYSSFKMAGVQIRGKNAATFQMIYMMVIFFINLIKLFWYVLITFLWFTYLIIKWFLDFTVGFIKGYREKELT